MTDFPTTKRVARGESYWTARMRYEHEFDAETPAREVDVDEVAQGASAIVRDGRVEIVRLPRALMRGQDEVEDLAEDVLEEIENGPSR